MAAVARVLQPSGRVEPAVVQEAVCPSTAAGQPPLAETAAQLEVERAVREEPEAHPACFVLNTRSGTYHRRADAESLSAVCGWSFRNNPHAFVPDVAAGPKCGAQLCARCWPSLRSVASAMGVVSLATVFFLPQLACEPRKQKRGMAARSVSRLVGGKVDPLSFPWVGVGLSFVLSMTHKRLLVGYRPNTCPWHFIVNTLL